MMPRIRRLLPLGAGIGALGVILSFIPWVIGLEESGGLGLLFNMRGAVPPRAPVVIVSIDRASAAALGVEDDTVRWPRSLHTRLVSALADAGAAVTVFDVSFEIERDPETDRALADAICNAGNVILLDRSEKEFLPAPVGPVRESAEVIKEIRETPIPLLKGAALASAPFPLPVVPVRLSQFWLFSPSFPDLPTLPVTAFQAFALPAYEDFVSLLREVSAGEAVDRLPLTLREARQRGPLEELMRDIRRIFIASPGLGGELRAALERTLAAGDVQRRGMLHALIGLYASEDSAYLNYYGPPRSFTTISYADLLGSTADAAALERLAGAVVFVGISEPRQPNQQDVFYSVFSQSSGLNLSGVEIAATAFSNLLEERPVRELSVAMHALVVFAFGAVVTILPSLATPLIGLALSLLLGSSYLGLAYAQFASQGLWLPVVVPLVLQLPIALIGVTLWMHRRLRFERDKSRAALSHYVPSTVLRRLLDDSAEAATGHRLLTGTCMVTDAAGYTRLSEALPPLALREFMNEYYDVLFRVVEWHGGMVSDVAGDTMVAVWPEPGTGTPSSVSACRAALGIATDLAVFNAKADTYPLPTRLGIHCGDLVFGTVGASAHYEYRAVGDIVNTASRIQDLNKRLRTSALLSANAWEGSEEFLTRKLGAFRLAGKDSAVVVYELLGARGQAADTLLIELSAQFADALDRFVHRDWAEAGRGFARILERFPGDGPSLYYVKLCQAYALRGLGDDWDGSVDE